MTQPWQPEHVVSLEDAKVYIEEQFSELMPVEITEYGKGFDNTVFLVNQDYVFRFPRREIAVRLLEKENRMLPELVGLLPLKISEPLYFGKPSKNFPWPFTGYRAIKGQMLHNLDETASQASGPDLALFLKKLHQFPVKKAERSGVPHDEIKRANMTKRLPMLKDHVRKLNEKQLYNDPDRLTAYSEGLNIIEAENEKVLVHGDLHLRNIVVNEMGSVKGVIDWGDLHIGSRAVDLSIAYSFLPPSSRKAFYKIYGEVKKPQKELARFIAIYILAILILYGSDHHDHSLINVCQQGLDWALTKE